MINLKDNHLGQNLYCRYLNKFMKIKFCSHNIFILSSQQQKYINSMSQSQTVQIGQLNDHLISDLGEHKVNPETLMSNNFHEANNKDAVINEDQKELSQMEANTPKRNKSQQKSAPLYEKQSKHKHSLSLTHSPNNKDRLHFKNADRIPEVEEQADHKNYEQLTMKLQLVLNKISSSSKVMSKSVSQSQNIMARFEECEERKRKQIDKKKGQYQQQKCKELKQKPTIDKNSDKISKEIGHKPIYLRVDVLVEEKKKKLQKNQELKKKKIEEEEHTYIQEYNKHVKKPDNIRSYDQYFSEMVRWKEKRLEENKQKFEIKKSKELEGITFQPILNPKSKKMMSSHPRLPIEQRGLVKIKKPAIQPKSEEQKTYKKLNTHQ